MLEVVQLTVQRHNHILYENLSFQLRSGEILGVLGQNGSGKTTLLLTLLGINPYSTGAIYLYNQQILAWPKKQLAQKMGIALQTGAMHFNQTVYEYCAQSRYPYLKYFSSMQREDHLIVEDVLKKMELWHKAQHPINSLSSGEKQRLKIASVFAQTPELFLLDEPTTHLDLYHQVRLLKYLRELQSLGHSAVVVLHDVNYVEQLCDQVLMLFPQGEFILGSCHTLLTQKWLEKLFNCPVVKLYPYGWSAKY